jgi:hypothetical protein
MAITADKLRKRKNLSSMFTDIVAVKTAAAVYVGGLVSYQGTGRVAAATNTASTTFAGEVLEFINETGASLSTITGNTAGTVKVVIGWGHQALVTLATSLRTTSKIGLLVYCKDNDTVTDDTGAGTAAVRIQVGNLITRVGSTEGYVALRRLSATTTS